MEDSVYTSVLGELVKSLQCYSFYFKLKIQESDTVRTRITPTPEFLYLEVNGEGIQIPTLAPIKTLTDLYSEQINDFLYIRVPCETQPTPYRHSRPPTRQYSRLACKQCGLTFATDFLETLPLPSLHWEELSDLWSCHPSLEPNFNFALKPMM
jgi:hypothetical protein